jgi:hypothetical protein
VYGINTLKKILVMEIFISLIKIILRLAFSYGVCLLFTVELNPLMWSVAAKVWLIIIAVILLSND